jgi:hypothetical protein
MGTTPFCCSHRSTTCRRARQEWHQSTQMGEHCNKGPQPYIGQTACATARTYLNEAMPELSTAA